jgi:soluble lytic murein transglycosylase-like protein
VYRKNRYDSLFQYYAEKHGFDDWLLLKAQAIAESNLDPDAVSWVGAKGLTQFMPATWREWWDKVYGVRGMPLGDPFNPERAIELQAAYMAKLLSVFVEVDRTLAAYNWGWGRVRKHLKLYGKLSHPHLPLETQKYILTIESTRKLLALA